MNRRWTLALITAGSIVGSWITGSHGVASTIHFEQSGDFDAFAKHQQGQFQQARWSASAGVGGGGGLEPFQGQVGHPNHSTHNQPLELTSIGDRIQIKALIRTRSLSQLSDTQSQEFGSVYLSDEPNGFPSHLANTAVAMFDRTNAATRLTGSTVGRAGAVHRFYINFAPGIIQGEWWYELSASLTTLPGDMLGWHIEVTDYGIDGLTRGGLVLGATETMEDRYHLTSNGSLFGGLSFVKAADNFAVKAIAIPEPASCLIVIWAGLVITFGGRSRI